MLELIQEAQEAKSNIREQIEKDKAILMETAKEALFALTYELEKLILDPVYINEKLQTIKRKVEQINYLKTI